MSVRIVLDGGDIGELLTALKPFSDFEPAELMTAIGALGESQTRRRISEEKTSPEGEAWKPNLREGDILVETGGHLLASVAYTASADQAEWGAAWEYAHVHQYGATIKPKEADKLVFSLGGKTVFAKEVTIPARPFVGLSSENAQEIIDLVTDHFGVGR